MNRVLEFRWHLHIAYRCCDLHLESHAGWRSPCKMYWPTEEPDNNLVVGKIHLKLKTTVQLKDQTASDDFRLAKDGNT